MSMPVIDGQETTALLPKRNTFGQERRWHALVFLAMLILTGIAGMGVLLYRLEHPVPAEMFQGR